MSSLAGRFYFKLTANNNLVGEYSNNLSSESVTESANRIIEAKDDAHPVVSRFIGDYHSTWIEEESDQPRSVLAKLSILPKEDRVNLFKLTWRSSEANFDGEAMLCDDILIGNYFAALR